MKQSTKILIIISLAALLLLAGIQIYLVQRTFDYQSNLLRERMRADIEDVLEPYNPTDQSIYMIYDTTRNLALRYKTKEKFRGQDFIDVVVKENMKEDIFGGFVKKELLKKGISDEFEYATVINYLGLNENGKQDNTFLFDTILVANRIEGTLASFENAIPVHSITHSEKDFLIGLKFLVDISQQESIVWQRMWKLLLGAVLSIIAVIAIFFYSIRTLIKLRSESERQKDFINNITHEFKTPMATIGLASKSLRIAKVQQNPKKIEELSNLIDRQNSRLQKLIDQAMESSLVSRNLVLNTESLAIHAFLQDRIHDFKIKFEKPDTQLKTRFAAKEVYLKIDTFHFTTMLYNLLDNAIKYSDDSPKIEVSTFVEEDHFLLQIADQGIGMDLKKDMDIFEKFFRVPSGNVHTVKGLGLGLFYVKKIVEAHQGTIRAESTLGEGTTFFIRLPLAEAVEKRKL